LVDQSVIERFQADANTLAGSSWRSLNDFSDDAGADGATALADGEA
jgi:hypothetical protein